MLWALLRSQDPQGPFPVGQLQARASALSVPICETADHCSSQIYSGCWGTAGEKGPGLRNSLSDEQVLLPPTLMTGFSPQCLLCAS